MQCFQHQLVVDIWVSINKSGDIYNHYITAQFYTFGNEFYLAATTA